MQTIVFSKARSELAGLLDQVARDHAPVEIVRREKSSVVVIDKGEYEALMETIHLLASPANATRLIEAKADIDSGRSEAHSLIDE